jgi:LmbE family N-acetylglucosaminyl deacetylase
LLEEQPEVQVHWVVFSGAGVRRSEAEDAARGFLGGGPHDVRVLDFPDRRFPSARADIKTVFDELGRSLKPDIVFTHRRHDAHQDHRELAELTWQTFRDDWILEYEIPKYEGDLGQPNVYVPLSAAVLDRKVALLGDLFPSQQEKPWYRPETFRGLAAVRGLECRADYAEAFHARKTVV